MTDHRVRPFEPLESALAGMSSKTRLAVVCLVSAVCFLLAVNSSWKATPDSALYLALGESLAHGNGYVFNGEPHAFVPPGYPFIQAVVVRLVGSSFFAYRSVMALLGFLTAVAGYVFLTRLCGRDTAFVAGGLFAVNHVLLENSTFTTSDVPFALFTLLALTAGLSVAKNTPRYTLLLLAGLLVSIPPLIRVNGLGVAPAMAFFFCCSWKGVSWKKRVFLAGLFLIVAYVPASVWQVWKAAAPAGYGEGSYIGTIAGRPIVDQVFVILHAAWGYFPETSYAMTGLVLKTGFLELFVPLVSIWGMVTAWRRGERLLVPLTVIQYSGFLLSSAGSRYLIFLIPGLYVFFALGLLRLCEFLKARFSSPRLQELRTARIIVVTCAFLAAFNLAHNGKTIYQARTALEHEGAESQRYLPFFTAARWLKVHAPNSVVLSMRPRIIHYLSGCRTASLLRGGVPYHKALVQDENEIRALVQQYRPSFLFTDAKDEVFYNGVIKSVTGMGIKLEPVPEAGTSPRYRLWKMRGTYPS